MICSKCEKEKELIEFNKNSNTCKCCIVIDKRAKATEKQRVKRRAKKQELSNTINQNLATTKECVKCKKIKPNEEFSIYGKIGSRRNYCMPCGRVMCKDYKSRNRDKISEYNKEYKGDHKLEIREYNRKWTANAIKTNIQYKIKSRLRIRINKVLNGIKKTDNTDKLLNCSLNFLLEWFKFRFTENMTMTNHGKLWHIDHVMPCASFDLTKDENQKKCFNWMNLQPMRGDLNIVKNDTIDTKEIFNQALKIQEFTQQHYNKTFLRYRKYEPLITK